MKRPLATENTHTPEMMRMGIVCCRYTVPVCVCVCVCVCVVCVCVSECCVCVCE